MNDSHLDALLRQMAAEHRPQLPSPGLLWFRAHLARKLQQQQRIERPLLVMRSLLALTAAMVFLIFAAANWGVLRDAIDHQGSFLLPLLLLTLAATLVSAAFLLRSPAKRVLKR